MKEIVKQQIETSETNTNSLYDNDTLADIIDVIAFTRASCFALKVTSGKEALDLLLRR